MDVLPPEFADPPYGSLEAVSCSPQVTDMAFRGIVIRIPQFIRLDGEETVQLPICGFYQLPSLPLMQGAVMVVHVRGVGATPTPPVSGQVVVDQGDNEPLAPDPEARTPIDPSLYVHKVSEAYFVLDGHRYLRSPLPAGTYDVMVTYGDVRSNIARVEIVRDR